VVELHGILPQEFIKTDKLGVGTAWCSKSGCWGMVLPKENVGGWCSQRRMLGDGAPKGECWLWNGAVLPKVEGDRENDVVI
jgi:hypothetical protein